MDINWHKYEGWRCEEFEIDTPFGVLHSYVGVEDNHIVSNIYINNRDVDIFYDRFDTVEEAKQKAEEEIKKFMLEVKEYVDKFV